MRPRIALVVEDEPMVRLFLNSRLKEHGFQVVSADTAEMGLMLARGQPHLEVAFIDLSLPGKTGLELMAALQGLFPELPIVIESGYGEFALRDMQAGARQSLVLTKPLDEAMIDAALSNLGLISSQ